MSMHTPISFITWGWWNLDIFRLSSMRFSISLKLYIPTNKATQFQCAENSMTVMCVIRGRSIYVLYKPIVVYSQTFQCLDCHQFLACILTGTQGSPVYNPKLPCRKALWSIIPSWKGQQFEGVLLVLVVSFIVILYCSIRVGGRVRENVYTHIRYHTCGRESERECIYTHTVPYVWEGE